MARKRILSLASYKFSMDLSGENKEAVDDATENYGMKYGPFINMLIKNFLRMPTGMKQAFTGFCISKCQELDKLLEVAGAMEKKSIEMEKEQYLEIARIINGGIDIHYDDTPDVFHAREEMETPIMSTWDNKQGYKQVIGEDYIDFLNWTH